MPNGGTHCCFNCAYSKANRNALSDAISEGDTVHFCEIRNLPLLSPGITYCENLEYSYKGSFLSKHDVKPVGVIRVLDYYALQGDIADEVFTKISLYLQNELSVSTNHSQEAAKNCLSKIALNYDLWKITFNNESLSNFGIDRLLLAVYCGLTNNTEELLSLYHPNAQEMRKIVYKYLCK